MNRGKFNFDTIRYERYLDATVAREALRAGLLDVWTETDSRHWLSSYDVPARGHGWLVLGTLVSGNQAGSRYRLALNTRRQPLDDLRVREALSRALDFEWQLRALHGGELTRAASFFAGSMFASLGFAGRSRKSATRTPSRAVARQAIHPPLLLPQYRWRGRRSRRFVEGEGTPRESRLSSRRRRDGQRHGVSPL